MNDAKLVQTLDCVKTVTRLHRCEKMLAYLAEYFAEQDQVGGEACPVCEWIGHGADCELVKLVEGKE